jgi:hypothetical protein
VKRNPMLPLGNGWAGPQPGEQCCTNTILF